MDDPQIFEATADHSPSADKSVLRKSMPGALW